MWVKELLGIKGLLTGPWVPWGQCCVLGSGLVLIYQMIIVVQLYLSPLNTERLSPLALPDTVGVDVLLFSETDRDVMLLHGGPNASFDTELFCHLSRNLLTSAFLSSLRLFTSLWSYCPQNILTSPQKRISKSWKNDDCIHFLFFMCDLTVQSHWSLCRSIAIPSVTNWENQKGF